MHDTRRVCRRQAAGDLRRDVERLAQSESGTTKRLALDQLADDVAVADVVHRDDVGVAQGRDGAGFDLEALAA